MDMPVVDDRSSTRKHESNRRLNAFGQGFGDDIVATGLLSAHRFRTLTVDHFAASIGKTYDYANRDLKNRLIRHKLFSQVRILRHEKGAGRPPVLLSVASRGYDHLCDAIRDRWRIEHPEKLIGDFSPPPSCIDWKGGRAHRLGLVHLMIAIERSARQHGGAGLVHVIPEYLEWNGLKKPTLIHLSCNTSFQADAVLIADDGQASWPVMVELDLGTETISSQDPGRVADTIEGKGKLYWQYLASKRFKERFGTTDGAFQVLFVTTSQRRVDNMREVIGDSGLLPIDGLDPSDVFYFATNEAASADFFGWHWQDLNGRRVNLAGLYGATP
ncbi:MAG: replication-relaxation family protein [Geminicoccaceae bacterium]